MRSIRPATFETNSSSCHCLVICPLNDWDRFTSGDLFARCAWYKSESIERLIGIDEVYSLAEKQFHEEYSPFQSETKPTFELVRWIYSSFSEDMLDPDEPRPIYDELPFRKPDDCWWQEHAPDSLKEFVAEHPDTLEELLNWMTLTETPFSYEMIRILSNGFKRSYDEYESIAPYEETDPRKMDLWGFNYLLGPDYPEPPVMKCRAIWYA